MEFFDALMRQKIKAINDRCEHPGNPVFMIRSEIQKQKRRCLFALSNSFIFQTRCDTIGANQAEERLQAARWMERLAEEEQWQRQIRRRMNGGLRLI